MGTIRHKGLRKGQIKDVIHTSSNDNAARSVGMSSAQLVTQDGNCFFITCV